MLSLLRGQQGLRREFSVLVPLQRTQVRVVAVLHGLASGMSVSTVAKGVSWKQGDVAASLSLMKAREGVLGEWAAVLPPTPWLMESQLPPLWSCHLHGPGLLDSSRWGVSGAVRELSLPVHKCR